MSTHEILVVQIESVSRHPNADSLDCVRLVDQGYSIISRRDQFKPGDLGIYIEPDYVVKTELPEFEFLSDNGRKKTVRITQRKLRGILSEGLLFPAKPEHVLGQNVIDEYQITRYEPPPPKSFKGWGNEGSDLQSGWCAPGPNVIAPKYDLENEKKYYRVIPEGTPVKYTVKTHGANFRGVFVDGKMYCGSRTTWKYEPGTVIQRKNTKTNEEFETIAPENSWWTAVYQNPWLIDWCRANSGVVVYGEIFGPDIQGTKFHYGLQKGQIGLRIFDVLENGQWVSFKKLREEKKYGSLKLVPCIYSGPHDRNILAQLAEAPETEYEGCGSDHVREGIVIKLHEEQYHEKIGRVALKYVSDQYLQRS